MSWIDSGFSSLDGGVIEVLRDETVGTDAKRGADGCTIRRGIISRGDRLGTLHTIPGMEATQSTLFYYAQISGELMVRRAWLDVIHYFSSAYRVIDSGSLHDQISEPNKRDNGSRSWDKRLQVRLSGSQAKSLHYRL